MLNLLRGSSDVVYERPLSTIAETLFLSAFSTVCVLFGANRDKFTCLCIELKNRKDAKPHALDLDKTRSLNILPLSVLSVSLGFSIGATSIL